jgi:hypothetical protein
MRRTLTAGERALAEEVFGDALDLASVRLFATPVGKRVFVPGRLAGRYWIVWPRASLKADFSAASLGEQALLVHELTHVWQAQQGVFLPFAKLKAGDSATSYSYAAFGPADFARMNIEQQATAVEHAFLARRGAPTPWAAELYAAALPFVPRADVQRA